MVRKEFFNQIGLYNEACITGQDNELWTRAKNHGAIFRYLDVPLMKYRINPASVRSVQETGYSFKLAKTCLSNHARQSVFQFLRTMEWKDRIQILVRMAIPFHIYRASALPEQPQEKETGVIQPLFELIPPNPRASSSRTIVLAVRCAAFPVSYNP